MLWSIGKHRPTDLEPRTRKLVDDLWDRLRAKQLDPWRMGFCSPEHVFEVTQFDGRKIRYQGFTFGGSTAEVFWGGYIEPFLRDGIQTVLTKTRESCRDSRLKPKKYLREAERLLQNLIHGVYRYMADIDYQLRSSKEQLRAPGTFTPAERRPTTSYTAPMENFLKGQVKAELRLASGDWRSQWSPGKKWAMGLALAVIITILGVFLGYLGLK